MGIWSRKTPKPRAPAQKNQPATAYGPPSADTQGAAARWRGYIDKIGPTSIEGWACDMDNLNASVAIEALTSGGRSLVVIASLYRKDVEDAGFGNGYHAFRFDTGKFGTTDESVTIRFLESKRPITAAPIYLDPCRALISTALPPSFGAALQRLAADVRYRHQVDTARSDETIAP